MQLYTINTGFFKLDGGAMFGIVPKTLWNRKNPADENNLCSWAMRCLLIEDGKDLILVDSGIGNKQDAKFFGFYDLHGDDDLLTNLNKLGLSPDQLTGNFITHLHFDHCGGSIRWNNDRTGYEATFPNARYYVSQEQWNLANTPNAREKASFLKENIAPMQELGVLELMDTQGHLSYNLSWESYYGHTDGQMLPMVKYKGRKVVFVADLLPSSAHIPLPWVMAYDTRPLITMEEKKAFLQRAAEENWILFFEHDPVVECCTVKQTEKGIVVDEVFRLSEV